MDHILYSIWKRLRMWRGIANRLRQLVKKLAEEIRSLIQMVALLERKVQRLEEIKHRYERLVEEIQYINKYSSMLEANELQVGEKLPPSFNINREEQFHNMRPWDSQETVVSVQVHYETLDMLHIRANRDMIDRRLHIKLSSRHGVVGYYISEDALKMRYNDEFPHSFMLFAMRELIRYWIKENGL